MKICISVVTYFPEQNGVQFVTQNLAEGLVKNGHEVTVLTRSFRKYRNDENVNGVKVIRCNIKDKNMFHFGNKKEFQNKILSQAQCVDVMLFVNLQSVAADWSLDILDSIKAQKILYMHGMHEFMWKKIDVASLKNIIYKIIRDVRWGIFYTVNQNKIRKFDKYIHLHSEDYAYKYFEKRFRGKNYVLENFAEDMFYTDKSNPKTCGSYYIYIANYHPRKNQMLLLKAFYLMQNDFELIFIGSQINQKYYNKLILEKKKLDQRYNVKKNIQFLYNITRKELPYYLANAYGFVMSSKSEYYPISVIEAMAAGLPVISTNVGIVKYLPGCIIVENKAREIALAMDELINNSDLYLYKRNTIKKYSENNFRFDFYLKKFESLLLR
ncbi:MAG: glycosyltransferase family 4 protein [Eubacterium sp.]|jgi:glycosyltransferase involved in cell wall biosynthesis|nr:glycosyltransferase family 4 protein [Eubacterium sp.]